MLWVADNAGWEVKSVPRPVHNRVSFGKTLIPDISRSWTSHQASVKLNMQSHIQAVGACSCVWLKRCFPSFIDGEHQCWEPWPTVTSSHAALTYGVWSRAALQFRVSVSITVSFVVWSFCDNTLPAALLPHSGILKCESVWGQWLAVTGTKMN